MISNSDSTCVPRATDSPIQRNPALVLSAFISYTADCTPRGLAEREISGNPPVPSPVPTATRRGRPDPQVGGRACLVSNDERRSAHDSTPIYESGGARSV